MLTNIDLHIHTNILDGKYTPKEVIDMAKSNKVKIISITDHDSIDAYLNEDLCTYAKDKEIKLINGVEISAKIDDVGIHVLGYNLDLNNEYLRESLFKIRK